MCLDLRALFVATLVAGSSAQDTFRLKPCGTKPKPYYCFIEGDTKIPAECPPPEFDAAKDFTLEMLK